MKKIFKIVFLGEVDSGKSTLIGRMVFDANSIPEDKKRELMKNHKIEFCDLLDSFQEEKEGKLSIETTQAFMTYHDNLYILIDVPGHWEFLKSILTGSSLAEFAVVLCNSEKQIKKYLLILKFLHIDEFIIAINKMDKVNYDKKFFKNVRETILNLSQNIKISPLAIIPISAKYGENIFRKSKKLNWYHGKSLLGYINAFNKKEKENKDFRFAVQDKYYINEEKIIVGKVLSGEIKKKEIMKVANSGEIVKIKEIKISNEKKFKAKEGDCIGLVIKNEEKINPVRKLGRGIKPSPSLKKYSPRFKPQGILSNGIKRGDVLYKKVTPIVSSEFKAHILCLNEICKDKKFILKCNFQQVNAKIANINIIKNLETGRIKKGENKIRKEEIGEVVIVTEKPLIFEKFKKIKELGSFALEKEREIFGLGIIN
jgi:sulfate adenylyltransferase subunit 1 (EFTu-like GTPase family)